MEVSVHHEIRRRDDAGFNERYTEIIPYSDAILLFTDSEKSQKEQLELGMVWPMKEQLLRADSKQFVNHKSLSLPHLLYNALKDQGDVLDQTSDWGMLLLACHSNFDLRYGASPPLPNTLPPPTAEVPSARRGDKSKTNETIAQVYYAPIRESVPSNSFAHILNDSYDWDGSPNVLCKGEEESMAGDPSSSHVSIPICTNNATATCSTQHQQLQFAAKPQNSPTVEATGTRGKAGSGNARHMEARLRGGQDRILPTQSELVQRLHFDTHIPGIYQNISENESIKDLYRAVLELEKRLQNQRY
ncbi:hypothetical protein B0O99DRAFT_685473 [Bisporella sp. PMI_857]|nr:hypothetical protein B0O99DRAFT_685473 [Bisporella sp. PMI_857]